MINQYMGVAPSTFQVVYISPFITGLWDPSCTIAIVPGGMPPETALPQLRWPAPRAPRFKFGQVKTN